MLGVGEFTGDAVSLRPHTVTLVGYYTPDETHWRLYWSTYIFLKCLSWPFVEYRLVELRMMAIDIINFKCAIACINIIEITA